MYFSDERNRRTAQRVFDLINSGGTDLADDVLEYDLAIYSDPARAQREHEMIFSRLPMMALHSSQIAQPGDFVTVQLNRTPVVVTRQKDGSVRALVNICRHRGATLVTQPSGRRPAFVCPYHGWSYGNDGTHRGVSFAETFGECGTRNLISLPIEERHGFIWIVEDPNGSIDVKAHLGDMDEALEQYGLEKYFFYREEIFEFRQNWKIMMDGLVDGYHVQFVHGKTISPYFYHNMMAVEILGDHEISTNPRKKIREIIDLEPGTEPLDRYVVIGNMFMPNGQLILQPHHVEYWTVYQQGDDPHHCRAHLRYLTKAEHPDERGIEILARNWEIAVAAVVNEDVPAGNSIQRSSESAVKGTICLGRNEITNQVFHKVYRRYMGE